MVFKKNADAITQTILEEATKAVKPTVSETKIKECEKIRDVFEGKSSIPHVGFINYK